MQTFRYRHNSRFQPFSRRFLARIKFQMPQEKQNKNCLLVTHPKTTITREGDRELSSYNIFSGKIGGGGGGGGHV